MADKRKPPESPDGGPRRKRAAPTIDLKATEVTDQPADNPQAATSAPQPEPAPESVRAAETPPGEASSEPAAAAPERPAKEPKKPEPKRAAPPPPSPPPPPRGGLGAGVTGGVIGAIVVAVLGAGAWYGGLFPSSSTQQSDLPDRIAGLEKQVQVLRNQPPPKLDTSALDKSVATLSQRVGKLESEIGNLPPTDKAAAQRLAALDSTVKSLSSAVSALGKRADDIAAAAKQAQQGVAAAEKAVNDLKQQVQNVATAQKSETPSVAPAALDALQNKITGLETELASMRKQLEGEIKNVRGDVTTVQDKVAKATAGDRAARLALSATALRNAVVSGAPYAAELAQAKSLGADVKMLAPLDAFAANGVPSTSALANELSSLIPALRKVAGAQETTGSFFDKLQANANKLVRITPVEAPAGNAPSDMLARIETEAARADIAGALADLGKLPDNVNAPARAWIAKAKARQDALAAAQSFAAAAARALSKG